MNLYYTLFTSEATYKQQEEADNLTLTLKAKLQFSRPEGSFKYPYISDTYNSMKDKCSVPLRCDTLNAEKPGVVTELRHHRHPGTTLMEGWWDVGGDWRWLALRNLIPELIAMTDEDKLKWVSWIRGSGRVEEGARRAPGFESRR